tara:strand:- start:285 stop:410 length:126 start_codon:yes stop_codon:yes gene_type:complete
MSRELKAEIERIEETYESIGLVTIKLKYLHQDLRKLENRDA